MDAQDTVDAMMAGLRRRTGLLKQAQAQAIAATGAARSADGQVSATVDSTGVVTGLQLSSSALLRNTPERLARAVVQTIQAAAAEARAKSQSALAAARPDLPDLNEVVDGAPGLTELTPSAPPVPRTAEPSGVPAPPEPVRRRHAAEYADDEQLGSIMRRGYP